MSRNGIVRTRALLVTFLAGFVGVACDEPAGPSKVGEAIMLDIPELAFGLWP